MQPWQDKFIDLDGIRAHYLEAGEGDVLLLLHGGGMSSCAELNYGDVVGPLSSHFRVIALDVVGFGETLGGNEGHYAASAQGDFIVNFMEALNLSGFVAGNSHGGWLAQYVAHEAPSRVQKLVIINSLNGTSPIPPEPEGLKYVFGPKGHPHDHPTLEGIERDLRAFFVHQDLVTVERIQRTLEISRMNYEYSRSRAEAVHATVESTNEDLTYCGHHISAIADRLDIPVLLTWSRENRGASPADALPYFNRLQRGEMHVFVDAGHHVMTEHPERWSRVVTDFLLSG